MNPFAPLAQWLETLFRGKDNEPEFRATPRPEFHKTRRRRPDEQPTKETA